MICSLCGTRVAEGERTCPACGNALKATDRVKEKDRGAGRGRRGAPPPEGLDVEPDEALDAEVEAGEEETDDVPRPDRKGAEGSPFSFALDPAGLRKLLVRQPELLEPGLGILTDDSGKPIGAGYVTPVGEIDLLAQDKSGAFVVVRVADRNEGEALVAEMLQRVGWVRKHLGKGKQKVRGIVLVEHAPDNLSYTAAAVAGTVSFKTYRVAVAFDDVDI